MRKVLFMLIVIAVGLISIKTTSYANSLVKEDVPDKDVKDVRTKLLDLESKMNSSFIFKSKRYDMGGLNTENSDMREIGVSYYISGLNGSEMTLYKLKGDKETDIAFTLGRSMQDILLKSTNRFKITNNDDKHDVTRISSIREEVKCFSDMLIALKKLNTVKMERIVCDCLTKTIDFRVPATRTISDFTVNGQQKYFSKSAKYYYDVTVRHGLGKLSGININYIVFDNSKEFIADKETFLFYDDIIKIPDWHYTGNEEGILKSILGKSKFNKKDNIKMNALFKKAVTILNKNDISYDRRVSDYFYGLK